MQFLVIYCHFFLSRTYSQSKASKCQQPIDRTSSGASTRLDLTSLDQAVLELFSVGLAQLTLKPYKSGSQRYIKFSADRDVVPFPVSGKVVCCFIAFLYLEGLSGNSMKSYLAALLFPQIVLGLTCQGQVMWFGALRRQADLGRKHAY